MIAYCPECDLPMYLDELQSNACPQCGNTEVIKSPERDVKIPTEHKSPRILKDVMHDAINELTKRSA